MRTLFEISVVCFEACRRCYVQKNVDFCCYWSDDTPCFRGFSPRNTENMKNLKTSKVPKLKFERFLKHMLCVLRPAEGAAYEKRDFTTMSSNYW